MRTTLAASPTRRAVLAGAAALALAPRLAAAQVPDASAAFALLPRTAAAGLTGLPSAAPKGAAAAEAARAQMAAYALRSARRWIDRAPQPMPVVHTEGTLPHQGIYDQSVEAKKDWQATRDLALGSRLAGDGAMAGKTVALIKAWLGVYKPSFNPIDETDLDRLMTAFDLLEGSARAPVAADYGKFLAALASGYLDRMPTLKGGTATNNWQSHRVKLATLAAYGAGDKALIERARAAYKKQLADNLRADGSVLDFAERDALHYVTYDLEPLLMAALAAKTHGEDWYGEKNAAGVGLKEALLWLAPYAEGKKTHQEFVRSTVAFDAARAKAGLPGFAGLWNKEEGEEVFTLAARLDAAFAPLAAALTPGFTGDKRPRSPWLHLTLPV
ncbi:MAG: alginate lyase family protein [Bauldia sp.]